MRSLTIAGAACLGLLLLARAAAGQVGPDGLASLARVALPAVVTITVPDESGEINQEPIRTMADFERLVDAVKPGDWLALLVQPGYAAVYVAVEARETAISAMPGMRRP